MKQKPCAKDSSQNSINFTVREFRKSFVQSLVSIVPLETPFEKCKVKYLLRNMNPCLIVYQYVLSETISIKKRNNTSNF